MRMKNKNYTLLIDDKLEFGEELKRQAKTHNIEIIHKTNYRDMEIILPSIAGKISVVILDIKCLKEPNQPIEGEDFLTLALGLLNEKYNFIPRAILTADPDGYSTVKRWFPQERLFKKIPGDISQLFEYINQKGLELENTQLKYKYSDIFSIFDKGYLPSTIENELTELLKNMDCSDLPSIKNSLSSIRRIQEKIFQTLNKTDNSIVPDNCLKPNKDIMFGVVHKHLSGNKTYQSNYQPTQKVYYSGIIETFSESIYRVTSDNGAHNPYNNPDYFPTKYTVQSSIFALLDFIKWFEVKMNEVSS